jgi:hypothetical protein
MPSHTPSQARRAIKVSLRALIDPELTNAQRSAAKRFFRDRCAFCDVDLTGTRAHMDHLISVSDGGPNDLSNRVPACARCNGDHKLDRDWREFLTEITSDREAYRDREERILRWTKKQASGVVTAPNDLQSLLDRETQAALAAFDAAVERLRAAKAQ